MLIVVVVQDDFSFQVLVVLNVEDVIDVDIQDIPIYIKIKVILFRKKINQSII
jgi:hypothetical protein